MHYIEYNVNVFIMYILRDYNDVKTYLRYYQNATSFMYFKELPTSKILCRFIMFM